MVYTVHWPLYKNSSNYSQKSKMSSPKYDSNFNILKMNYIYKQYILCNYTGTICSWGSSVTIVTRLQAGWSGVRFPAAARDCFSSLKCPYWCWDPSSLLFHGYCVFIAWSWSGWGTKLANHPHLVLTLGTSEAIPPIPLYSFTECTGTTLHTLCNTLTLITI